VARQRAPNRDPELVPGYIFAVYIVLYFIYNVRVSSHVQSAGLQRNRIFVITLHIRNNIVFVQVFLVRVSVRSFNAIFRRIAFHAVEIFVAAQNFYVAAGIIFVQVVAEIIVGRVGEVVVNATEELPLIVVVQTIQSNILTAPRTGCIIKGIGQELQRAYAAPRGSFSIFFRI